MHDDAITAGLNTGTEGDANVHARMEDALTTEGILTLAKTLRDPSTHRPERRHCFTPKIRGGDES